MSLRTTDPSVSPDQPDFDPDSSNTRDSTPDVSRGLMAAFFLLLLAISVGFGGFAWGRFKAEQHAAQDELGAVTKLKIVQLVAWRQERLGDAAVVANVPGLANLISLLSASPASIPPQLGEIDTYLNAALRTYSYKEIHLLDAALKPVRSYPDGRVWDEIVSQQYRQELLNSALTTGQSEPPLFEDVHLDNSGLAGMHVLVRVRSTSGQFVGVVLLTIGAESGLFGIVQSWPVESPSAETLLVRREGESIRYLNPLRHQTGVVTKTTLPASHPELLAARAFRSNRDGLIQGVDYRGVPSVGVALPVPGTAWMLISKMDESEAYANAWRELRQLTIALILLLLVLVLFGRLWLQHRQSVQMTQSLEVERKRRAAAQRLAIVMRHANDVIFLFDDSMRVVDANERATVAYGYTLQELLQLTVADLRAPETKSEVQHQFQAARNEQGFTFETMHRRKNGDLFPVEVSSRPVLLEGRRHVLSIIRENSQRKAHEEEIGRLNRLYRVISEVNQVLVRAGSRTELFNQICGVLVRQGGFRIAWVGCFNAQTRFIHPVAVAGDVTGYTREIRIAADAALPEGHGPSGTAFRENRVYVSNDFFADPNTVPWRERAANAGFHSSIALPLHQENVPVGLLTVYAAEKNFFGSREIELLKETAGDISFALGVFEREQQRRTAEAALEASENRLQFLMSATPAIIYSLRAGGDFATTFLSPNIREVLGYEPAEVMADPGFWRAHLHPDDVASATALFAELESRSTITREYRFRHADGSWRWMHDELRVAQGADGRPAELVGYWIDVTAARLAEAELRKLSLAVEQSPATVIITDLTGAIEYVNPRFVELTGYTREEVVGKNPRILKSNLTTAEVYADLWRTITAGRVWRGEIVNRKKDGTVFTELAIIAPVKDSNGRPTHFLALKEDITERKRSEAELRKLSRIVEQAPLSIGITDLQGAIEYVNPAFLANTGYRRDEILGQNPRVLKSGLTPPETYVDMWKTLTKGQVWRGELVNRRKDGSTYFERAVIAPVVDDDGTATHYVALKEDVTEYKRNEAALRQSEQRFRELFDLESDAILVYEVETGRITMANQAASQNYGHPIHRLLEMRTDEISAEPQATAASRTSLAASDGRTEFVPLRLHRRADGSVFPVEINHRTFRWDGKLLAVAAVRDITLQQQAREKLERFNIELEQQVLERTGELAARNREIEALLQSIPDLLMRFNRDGTLLKLQPARGTTPLATLVPSAEGFTAADLPKPLLKAALSAGASAMAGGATTIAEAEMTLGTASLTAELRVAPIGGEEYVVFVRDITERKRFELETASMLEKERQVSEMKTRFISVTSHEFRTPMTAAMGSVELLSNHFERLAPAKRQELLGRVTLSLHRMTEMLDEVLLLNRMDARRVEMKLVPANLPYQLHSFIEEIRLGDRDAHKFDLQVSGDLEGFPTDLNLLHHIVSNLLSNAVRYSPAGSTVSVCLTGETGRVTLSVQDQGIGIPDKDRARIFEPFERGTNVGNIKGTGLGLNIVKRLTEMLGGAIDVESVVPTGTRFTLTLPRQNPSPTLL